MSSAQNKINTAVGSSSLMLSDERAILALEELEAVSSTDLGMATVHIGINRHSGEQIVLVMTASSNKHCMIGKEADLHCYAPKPSLNIIR